MIHRPSIALRLHVLAGLAHNSSMAGDSSIKAHPGAGPHVIAGRRQATQTPCQVMDEHYDIQQETGNRRSVSMPSSWNPIRRFWGF